MSEEEDYKREKEEAEIQRSEADINLGIQSRSEREKARSLWQTQYTKIILLVPQEC